MEFNIADKLKDWKPTVSKHKNFRDELITRLTDGINNSRQGTKYKLTTKRDVAIRANKNPFLVSDSELELLIKECESKGSFAKFYWITK